MTWPRIPAGLLAVLVAVGGCTNAPINPPIEHADPTVGYRIQNRENFARHKEDIIVLAFSGGGMRAAAFSYGVLEVLRDIEVIGPKGERQRMLDLVDVITGVSGGSFTALAYGLHGDRLFAEYEQRFLKRNVERELIDRVLNPLNWGSLASPDWGRSELAADLYDEILFEGATFTDLQRRPGPLIVASATDLTSGTPFYYTQTMFDIICSDLSAVRLSRAAAASSSVPVVLSPVTIYNYGGTCARKVPWFLTTFQQSEPLPRPAARAIQELKELQYYEDSKQRPFFHLVDGSVADNLGMREILAILDELEALRLAGIDAPLDYARRLAVFVVNATSAPPLDWDQKKSAPGTADILLRANRVPITHYSNDTVETLRDTAARWKLLRAVRDSGAIVDDGNPALREVTRVPNLEVYVINVSFEELDDEKERTFLNEQPTSFYLTADAVDRLRAAARRIVLASPEFRQFLKDSGARIVNVPALPGKAPSPP